MLPTPPTATLLGRKASNSCRRAKRVSRSATSLYSRLTCEQMISKLCRHCASARRRSKACVAGKAEAPRRTLKTTDELSTPQRNTLPVSSWPYSSAR